MKYKMPQIFFASLTSAYSCLSDVLALMPHRWAIGRPKKRDTNNKDWMKAPSASSLHKIKQLCCCCCCFSGISSIFLFIYKLFKPKSRPTNKSYHGKKLSIRCNLFVCGFNRDRRGAHSLAILVADLIEDWLCVVCFVVCFQTISSDNI